MRKISPIPDSPQMRFLASPVRELGFGGQAGGGKSWALILDALGQLHLENYQAVIFRRTFKQLAGADGLIDLSHRVYPLIGGEYSKTDHLWTFKQYPGAIRFAHLEHEETVHNYDGHQFGWIGFDELQHFSERQYLYLFSRNRSSNPEITPYVRATFNPGGIGHRWIKSRFIDPFKTSHGFRPKPLYFKRVDNQDTLTGKDDPLTISRLFIPSRLEDNPYLWRNGNSDYEAGLRQLDEVDYRRLRFGDWDIKRTGLVNHAFGESCLASPDSVNWDKCAFFYALDFGAVNEVWGLFAQDEAGVFYLMHEAKLPDMTTKTRAERILSRLADRKVIRGWGGAKSEQQQRRDYREAGLLISEPPISDVEGGINAANQLFEQGRLKICRNMYYTIDQLENCVRDDKEAIAEKSSWHHLDVLRYFASGVYQQPGRVVSAVVSASKLLG